MAVNIATMRAVRIDADASVSEVELTIDELSGGVCERIALTGALDLWVQDAGGESCNHKATLLAVHCGVPFRRYGGAVVVTGNVGGEAIGLSREKAHALCGLANLLGDVLTLTCEPSEPWRSHMSLELQGI